MSGGCIVAKLTPQEQKELDALFKFFNATQEITSLTQEEAHIGRRVIEDRILALQGKGKRVGRPTRPQQLLDSADVQIALAMVTGRITYSEAVGMIESVCFVGTRQAQRYLKRARQQANNVALRLGYPIKSKR